MEIRRHSPFFLVIFSLLTILLVLVAYMSFVSSISIEDCLELDLPVLTIETEGAKKIKSREHYLSADYFAIEKNGISKAGKCKIRGRGNTTWETRELYKKPYLLKLDDKASLFGLPSSRKWILMANTADKTQIRNFYAEHIAKKVFSNFRWTPSSTFISLFVNGKYEGLYALTEKIEAVEGRIPVSEEDGSFVFEVNQRMDGDYNFRTNLGVPFSIKTNLETLSAQELTRRKKIIQAAENEIFAIEDTKNDFERPSLDLPSFSDWYLINELTKNHDARFQFSCYLYYDAQENKVFMGPIWDFDISCGNISWDDCENPTGFWVRDAVWLKRLLETKEFENLVTNRWNQKKDEISTSIEWLLSTSKSLNDAVMLNDSVWKNIGHRQWPHTHGWKTRKTYESEVEYMTGWLKKRLVWMDKALESSNISESLKNGA